MVALYCSRAASSRAHFSFEADEVSSASADAALGDDDDDDDDDDDELNRRKYDEPLNPNPTKSDPNANGEESRTDDEGNDDDARESQGVRQGVFTRSPTRDEE